MNTLKYNFLLRRYATILAIAILTLAIVAAITGILIGFYYQPVAGNAYKSLAYINNRVPFGWLIYGLHNISGNGIIIVSLVQLVVLFLGRQFRTSWLTAWIGGVLLTLSTIALGWTAMILSWTQLGFWRLKVELSIIGSIPFIGETIQNILVGGGGINTSTITRFYTLHSYVLSVAAIVLSVVHLVALLVQEQERISLPLKQLKQVFTSLSTPLEPTKEKVENVTS